MSTRGRKPTPTKLRALRGKRKKEEEPQPKALSSQAPKPPTHLDRRARRAWRRLTPELIRLGLLTEVDLDLFAGWCVAWSRWLEAEAEVKKLGTVIKSPNGYPVQNPYLSISNAAFKQMRDLGAEFGLTPSARTRLELPKGKEVDPFDAFLQDTPA